MKCDPHSNYLIANPVVPIKDEKLQQLLESHKRFVEREKAAGRTVRVRGI